MQGGYCAMQMIVLLDPWLQTLLVQNITYGIRFQWNVKLCWIWKKFPEFPCDMVFSLCLFSGKPSETDPNPVEIASGCCNVSLHPVPPAIFLFSPSLSLFWSHWLGFVFYRFTPTITTWTGSHRSMKAFIPKHQSMQLKNTNQVL